jgi:hypothetical protein
VTPEINAHSFDRPRDREVPASLSGRWLNGEAVTIDLDVPTLVVAIKPHCDGCREFVHSPLKEFDGLRVIVVSAASDTDGEWDDALQPVLVAPEVFDALDIKSPPFYVLIDPTTHRVVLEGVVFGPSQVAEELERHHTR